MFEVSNPLYLNPSGIIIKGIFVKNRIALEYRNFIIPYSSFTPISIDVNDFSITFDDYNSTYTSSPSFNTMVPKDTFMIINF